MILSFNDYVKLKKVKKGTPNISRAKALIKIAIKRLKFCPQINEENCIFVFEDYYESLKEILQAFMEAEGYHPYSHEAIIAFARDKLNLSGKDINEMDRMRKVRNDILYRGENVDFPILLSLVNFAKDLINRLLEEFRKRYGEI